VGRRDGSPWRGDPGHEDRLAYASPMRHRVPAWVVPSVVTAAAAVVLFVRLGTPSGIVFDEVYYVEDARRILEQGVEAGFAVHPPLGKWLIAAGAATGAATVLLTVLIARRLTGRPALAVLAGGLLALDGVFVVQARTAMLDVFLAGFVALGAYLLVVDHQRAGSGTRWSRWALVLAGVALGAGVATKWSGALALLAAAALVGTWEYAAARRARASGTRPDGPPPEARPDAPIAQARPDAPIAQARPDAPVAQARPDGPPAEARSGGPVGGAGEPPGPPARWRASLRAGGVVALAVALPAVTAYALSWAPWLVRFEATRTAEVRCEQQLTGDACRFGLPERIDGLASHHVDVLRFHLDLDADHPYRAPATTWLVQSRPVVYHWEVCEDEDDLADCDVAPGNAAEVVALGNLALWWGSLALLPVLVAGAIRRDGRSSVPLAFVAAQYLPWLVVARPVFSFYAVPLVPFLAVGVAVACEELDRPHRWLATVVGTVVGAAVGALAATWAGVGAAGVGAAAAGVALGGTILGAVLDDGRPPAPEPAGPRRVGTFLAGTIALLAVAAAVYFAPIWLAIELPEEAIRQRWWFPGWI
jgi:dolichyl-phosphate-mannose-protein mannosyltransferase